MENNSSQSEIIFFDFIRDKTGFKGLSVSRKIDGLFQHSYIINDNSEEFLEVVKKLFSEDTIKICWDYRQVVDMSLDIRDDIIDLSFFFNDKSFIKATLNNISKEKLEDFANSRKKIGSHLRACRIAKINVDAHSIQDIIPKKIIISFYRSKNEMLRLLYESLDFSKIKKYKTDTIKKIKTFYEMETHGIYIDKEIEYDKSNPANNSFMKKIKDKNGIVHTKFNISNLTKTGRVHTEKGSFACMSIPKNEIRKCVVSRFDNGNIISLDMNAADYRCLVASIDNEFVREFYKDAEDFHVRTTEFLFGKNNSTHQRRTAIKNITYTFLYGASNSRLSLQTGLSKDIIEKILEKLSKLFDPIKEFKNKIVVESRKNLYIEDPLGDRIILDGTEHDGKILALYAQRCCSLVFMEGVAAAHEFLKEYESKDIFTVHDELVCDISPNEIDIIDSLKYIMEDGTSKIFNTRMKVNCSIGKNYWEASR